jgi:hypothetical protein
MEQKDRPSVLDLIEELDALIEGEEELPRTRESEGVKVTFNKLFDYDPGFRTYAIAALAVGVGLLMYKQGRILNRMMDIFGAISIKIQALKEYQGGE